MGNVCRSSPRPAPLTVSKILSKSTGIRSAPLRSMWPMKTQPVRPYERRWMRQPIAVLISTRRVLPPSDYKTAPAVGKTVIGECLIA